MDFSCPENSSSASAEDHHDLIKKAIQVSINGRQLATQLLILTGSGKPSSSSLDSGCYADDGSSAANDLLVKILESFTHSISLLNHATSDKFSDQLPPNTPVLASSPSYWDGRKSGEDSDESSRSTTSSLKQRRGCYKRRKTSHTWTKVTPTLIDDGHAWRKYGQKVILNAKHPRNYFRCTHKFDQGCQATKQVQRTEEEDGDPPMYRITYHGHHTCRNLLIKSPHHQIILMQQDFSKTPTPTDSPGVLLSFGSPNTNHKSHQQPSFFPNFPCSSLTKQEHEDIKKPCSLNHHNQSAPSDFLLSPPDHPTTTTFEPSGPLTTVLSSGSDHDHGDVISNSEIYSCTASTRSDHHGFDADMDMDMVLAGPVKFDDDALQFEFE